MTTTMFDRKWRKNLPPMTLSLIRQRCRTTNQSATITATFRIMVMLFFLTRTSTIITAVNALVTTNIAADGCFCLRRSKVLLQRNSIKDEMMRIEATCPIECILRQKQSSKYDYIGRRHVSSRLVLHAKDNKQNDYDDNNKRTGKNYETDTEDSIRRGGGIFGYFSGDGNDKDGKEKDSSKSEKNERKIKAKKDEKEGKSWVSRLTKKLISSEPPPLTEEEKRKLKRDEEIESVIASIRTVRRRCLQILRLNDDKSSVNSSSVSAADAAALLEEIDKEEALLLGRKPVKRTADGTIIVNINDKTNVEQRNFAPLRPITETFEKIEQDLLRIRGEQLMLVSQQQQKKQNIVGEKITEKITQLSKPKKEPEAILSTGKQQLRDLWGRIQKNRKDREQQQKLDMKKKEEEKKRVAQREKEFEEKAAKERMEQLRRVQKEREQLERELKKRQKKEERERKEKEQREKEQRERDRELKELQEQVRQKREKLKGREELGWFERAFGERIDENKEKDEPPTSKKAVNGTITQGISSGLTTASSFISGVWESVSSGGTTTEEEEWLIVCPKTRLSPGEIVAVTKAGIDLLIVASKDGNRLYCIENSCPHLGTPLETGTLERRKMEKSTSTSQKNAMGNIVDAAAAAASGTSFANNDGCEDCIVCPLHQTVFALENGESRGEWCPYPPIIGPLTGALKGRSNLPTFSIRTRGKNVEVKINSMLDDDMNNNIDPKKSK